VLKIINASVPAQAPSVTAEHPSSTATGDSVEFTAKTTSAKIPAVEYHWDFGDGVSVEGPQVSHAYTHSGNYTVTLRAKGLDGLVGKTEFRIAVNGAIPTRFNPADVHRPASQQ
jgi:PKD repeat protein